MQSTKTRHLRNFEMKEVSHEAFWPKIALKMKTVKAKLFPKEDLAQLHLERTKLANYNNEHIAKRSEMETTARIFMFNR